MKHQKIKVLINGAFGKMGSLASNTLRDSETFEVIGRIGRADSLIQNLIQHKPDLALDLTQADCVFENCLTYIETQTPFVIGASGLTTEQTENLQKTCKNLKLGGLIVPNFSIGSLLCTHFAKLAAPWFDGVEIIEMHHHLKIDSPSGTALHTAEAISQSKAKWPNMQTTPQAGREYFKNQIPIHSIRMPGLLAVQNIIFGQLGETINLQHQIIDRQAYMPGLKLACEQAPNLKELKIGLDHLLFN